jgi:hypothetical protein
MHVRDEIFVASPEGPTPIRSLGDLLERRSTAGTLDIAGRPPTSTVRSQC